MSHALPKTTDLSGAFSPPSSPAEIQGDVLLALRASSSGIVRRIHEATLTGVVSRCRVVEVRPKETLCVQPNQEVLIPLDEGALLSNGVPRRLPVGYPLTDRIASHGGSVRIVDSAPVRFACIPQRDFEQLLLDPGFTAGIQKTIDAAHPAGAMPEQAREKIRHTRSQNIVALMTRQFIKSVCGPEGILRILNPEGHTVQSPFESRFTSSEINTVQQTWAIVRGVSTLVMHLHRYQLIRLAHKARAQVEHFEFPEKDKAGLALHTFRIMVRQREGELIRNQFPLLRKVLEDSQLDPPACNKLFGRMLEIAWLASTLKKERTGSETAPWDQIAANVLQRALRTSAGSLRGVLRALDAPIERLFNELRRQAVPDILPIVIDSHSARLNLHPSTARELPRSHRSYLALSDLSTRLGRGEVSAVGGSAYAAMRFPDGMLEDVSAGQVPVVIFNGSHQEGIRYVRQRFGQSTVEPGVLEPCTVVNAQGAYGAFGRSWIFFRDGRSVVLVSHFGLSRQLSNAGALLLYRNADNQRVPLENISLVDGCENLEEQVRGDLAGVLRKSEAEIEGRTVLGIKVSSAKDLPTQPLILLHPKQLEKTSDLKIELKEYHCPSLGPVQIGYGKNPDGGLTRFVISTVGGAGLYGDTAGFFVDAVFDKTVISNLIPHVLFSATAGGFSGTDRLRTFKVKKVRGLPPVTPEGFLMPIEEIHDDAGAMQMTTLLHRAAGLAELSAERDALETAVANGHVHIYSRHFCVSHPGAETYQKNEQLVQEHLVSSIDVEAGPIQRAIIRAQREHPEATFTPIYNFSDDPRSGKEDRFKTLAFGGPLHDNWAPDLRLNSVLRALIDLAWGCHKAWKGR